LGEYSYVVSREEDAVDMLCDFLERDNNDDVRLWVISALAKLVAQTQNLPSQVPKSNICAPYIFPQVKELVTKYTTSRDSELEQRCDELLLFSSDEVWLKFMKAG
jgi:hypothetical protein